MSRRDTSVLIVGAGPVGLLIALALGKANIPTILLEKHVGSLPNTTRAMVYQPVVLECLEKLGILEKIKQLAYLNNHGIVWRNKEGTALATLPMEESEIVLILGQTKMANFLLQELKQYPSVQVRFGEYVVGVEQGENSPESGQRHATVTALVQETNTKSEDEYVINARFLIGSDGANSSIRQALCIPFEGFSWTDFTLVGCDVFYDFSKNNNWGTPMQFIVDPDEWAVVIYTGQDENGEPYGDAAPLWRVAYADSTDIDSADSEKFIKGVEERIRRYAQGDTDFRIARAEPYRVKQRCAAVANKGNAFLAGDALHSNNPIGGLGLTTGILDAFCYGNALVRVLQGDEDPKLLIQCGESRRQAFLNATNPDSIRNLKFIRSQDPEDVKARDQFFDKLKNDSEFPRKMREGMAKMLPETFEASSGQQNGNTESKNSTGLLGKVKQVFKSNGRKG